MTSLSSGLTAFLRSEEGPSATEYAFMLALIVLLTWTVMAGSGEGVKNAFSFLDTELNKNSPM